MANRKDAQQIQTGLPWWTQLSVAVQRATAISAAGREWPAASRAAADDPAFERVLDLVACCRSERERSLSAGSSRLKTVPSGRRKTNPQ